MTGIPHLRSSPLSLQKDICYFLLQWFLLNTNSAKTSDLQGLVQAKYGREDLQRPPVPSMSHPQMETRCLVFCWECEEPGPLGQRGSRPSPWFSGMTSPCVSVFLPILTPCPFPSPCCLVLENFPQCVLEISDQEVLEWYTAKDVIVGKPLTMLGRTFFIYDCDPFTRQYYKEKFGISDLPRIDVSKKEPPPVKQVTRQQF